MPFDHLVHWVPDLDAAMEQYRSLGFYPVYGGEHQGRGTLSVLCHIGLPFVELLTVHDWDLVRNWQPTDVARIEEALDAGGGALDFAAEVDDLAGTVTRIRAAGLRVQDPVHRTRRRPDDSTVSWTSARVLEGPLWRPSFIQWDLAPGPRRVDLVTHGFITSPQDHWILDHVVVETMDPTGGARWLSQVLTLPAALPRPAGITVRLPGCNLVLARGPAERITKVVFATPEGPTGEIAGLAFAPRA